MDELKKVSIYAIIQELLRRKKAEIVLDDNYYIIKISKEVNIFE